MDSGLGSIGRKWVKWIVRLVIGGIRLLTDHPVRNAVFLIIILLILGTQFQPGTIGKFEFEYSEHEFYAGSLYYFIIPILLCINSAFFKRNRMIALSAFISGILVAIMFLVFFYQLFTLIFTFSPNIIRRTTTSGDQIVTLYEKRLDDLNSCRYLVRQRRIVPGILSSDVKLIKETCRFDGNGNPFPPNLK
jgi:small-conductance mechanosensitive channel